jgi:hypothetical protein
MDHASMVRGSDAFARPQENAQRFNDRAQRQKFAAQRPE